MSKLIKNKLLTIFIFSLVPLVLVLLPKATVPKDSLISPVKAQSSDRPYPIGWYDYIGHPNKLVEYAADGVSIVLPYNAAVTDDNTIRSYLDEAQRQGIKVIMDFRTPPVLCSPCPGPDELARKASLIKNHPALYAYYISDEPEFNGETAEKLKAIYRAIKSEDPNHPILIVHYHQIYPWNIYETWADAMDTLMIDWYPGWNCDQLGGGCDLEFDMMVRYSYSNWLNGVNWVKRHGKQGFIAVPAGFGADKGAQDMTDAEYRFHVFSAMVLDTDAIVFWQYFGSHPPNNTIKPRIDRVIRQVQAIGGEMNNGTTNDPQITVSELDRNKLVYRYGVSSSRGVILAVNIARWDASDNNGQALSNVQFTLPAGVRPSKVQVIGEDRDDIPVSNGAFTDNFSRFEVHAYAFPVDGSLPTSSPTPGGPILTRTPTPSLPPSSSELLTIRAPGGGVTIDSHLSEFAGANSVSFSDNSGRGAGDNKAVVKTMWDDDYLYIAYDVSDTKLNSSVTSAGQGAIWEDDNLEILIDRNHDHGTWKGTDDHQYFVNLNNVRDDRGENPGANAFKSAVLLNGTLNNNNDIDQGYKIEMALAWSALGGKPSSGDKIGIDFAAGDKDPSGGYQYYDWANLTTFAQPSLWGNLLFTTETPSSAPSPTIPASCPRKSQGDANCDGSIDGIDYSLWLNTQCRRTTTQSCADTRADFNADGNVDDSDYNIWFNNRGK